MIEISNSRERSLWIMRHGMRIDLADSDWVKTAENRYDPPLHPRGLLQAGETSKRLRQEQIDRIVTSPFLRTLQTASTVASGMEKKFSVEEGLAEWLRGDEFQIRPEYYDREMVCREFPHFSGDYHCISPIGVFPESRDALDTRLKKTVAGLMERYEGNILIITHASPIDAVFRVLLDHDPDKYHIMCAVSRIDYRNRVWSLGLHKDSRHLSNPDSFEEAAHCKL